MKIKILRFELSDEHAASGKGRPLLIDTGTGTAYGAKDTILLSSSQQWDPVQIVQSWLGNPRKKLTKKEREFCQRFIDLAK
jgi:hypothetical protein